MKALGAYIFAGGFTLGVRKHFDVLAHFEEGPYGVATARLNFGDDFPIFVGPDTWPVEEEKYQGLDFLYGNPPCAAWSQANGKPLDNWRTDPRVDCTRRHFELLEKLRPKVWVWESVAATFAKGREFIDQLVGRALEMGYAVTLFLHDGQYLGIPQRRKRFFFVAHRIKLDLDPPDWTITPCGEALRKINDIGEHHREAVTYLERNAWLLPHCKPGQDLRTAFNDYMAAQGYTEDTMPKNAHGHVQGRPGFLVKRSHPDEVAYTVTADQVHPTENRFLTTNEIKALCGYPMDFNLAPPANQIQEFTRAVMPPVGEYLARMVAKAVERDEPVTGKPTCMIVDYTHPPGSTEEVVLVDGNLESGRSPAPVGAKAPAGDPVVAAASAALRPQVLHSHPVPRPKPGVKRMAFLQVLIMMDRWTPAQMVEIVKHHWPDSKASNADVSTQRGVLRDKGHTPPATRRTPAEALPW